MQLVNLLQLNWHIILVSVLALAVLSAGIAGIAGVAASSAAIAAFIKRFVVSDTLSTAELSVKESGSDEIRGLSKRFDEVREGIRKHRAIALAYGVADSIFIGGQYVVAGLLASSLIQDQLPRNAIGALGCGVLLCTLLRQSFRPGVRSIGALERVFILSEAQRKAEDLFAKRDGKADTPSVADIRDILSKALTAVEKSEFDYVRVLNDAIRDEDRKRTKPARRSSREGGS